MTKRMIWASCCALLVACGESRPGAVSGAPSISTSEDAVVNFANFIEEISPETIPNFTAETGIAVNYDTYDLNQTLETRLLVGRSGLDLVVPSSHFLERQIQAGIYQKLDKDRLPSRKHLDPSLLQQLAHNDPGNQFTIPYLWGTWGIGYNVARVEAALGGPAPDSWALLFDPKYATRLQKCGIVVMDLPYGMIGFALLYLGRDPGGARPEDLAAAMNALMAIRPYVSEITSSSVTQQLVDGQACIAVGVSGDFYLARRLARENEVDVEIRFVIPEEGSLLWIDTLAVPIDAPHPGNAHRLIDYLMRPEVIAKVTEWTGYANANLAATPLVRTELRSDPVVYPDEATRARLHLPASQSEEYTRRVNREFTRFRTGT
jgi:putrescine transport system substrate-binding protein